MFGGIIGGQQINETQESLDFRDSKNRGEITWFLQLVFPGPVADLGNQRKAKNLDFVWAEKFI